MLITGLVILNDRHFACTFDYTIEPMRQASGATAAGVVVKYLNLAGNPNVMVNEEIQFKLVIDELTYLLKGVYLGHGRIELP